jgi:hypothetical protein
MKPERIEELLKNTEYASAFDTSRPRRTPEYDDIVEARSKLSGDAELNAARVQLLAKALRDARESMPSWQSYASDYFKEKHNADKDIAAIDAALKEAGL